jgi:hypothetical protein
VEINFQADSVDVSRRKLDGSRQVVLTVGEYEVNKIAGLLLVPESKMIKVSLEIDDNE